ncbi:MAG: enoyl-CoA hydratase-related protein, partial [Rhodospirillales bacterium]|nr:enoyl-CoA hydratase-related protein [Rhodospirillales bacterium]
MNIQTDGPLVRLEMTRPRLLNAVAMTGAQELLDATRWIAEDEAIRMVAITGAGRAFYTGINLKDLSAGRIE